MRSLTKFTLLTFSLFFLCFKSNAQSANGSDSVGYVNFNLGTSTLKHNNKHAVELYGCNTIIVDTSGFYWNKANQILANVPYGNRPDPLTTDSFYVSKYYIASPPVFKMNGKGVSSDSVLYDIGIVTPDEFVLNGEKPVQMVYMDYSILKPVYIKYLPIEFDTSFQHIHDSLKGLLNIDLVPFRVEADGFPWIDTNGITGAKGASGIGSLSWKSKRPAQLFLPYYYSGKGSKKTQQYLDFEVTILNDILLHYEVSFMIKGKSYKTINLKDHQNDVITFHCEYREELPCGCVESAKKMKRNN